MLHTHKKPLWGSSLFIRNLSQYMGKKRILIVASFYRAKKLVKVMVLWPRYTRDAPRRVLILTWVTFSRDCWKKFPIKNYNPPLKENRRHWKPSETFKNKHMDDFVYRIHTFKNKHMDDRVYLNLIHTFENKHMDDRVFIIILCIHLKINSWVIGFILYIHLKINTWVIGFILYIHLKINTWMIKFISYIHLKINRFGWKGFECFIYYCLQIANGWL